MSSKYVVIICDGMSDFPMDEFGGKTVLDYAATPNMDKLAAMGSCGLAKTVPDGMTPGSDIANLSIFGYNPRKFFTGRAPLEAINLGLELGEKDAAFRCNILTLENGRMKDFCADHIDTALSSVIIEEFNRQNENSDFEFYTGVSYRNIFIWRNYPYKDITSATPPHDIQGKDTSSYLPSGSGSEEILSLMKKSESVIASSAVKEAMKKYKGDPFSFWIWGGGRKPALTKYSDRFSLKGVTISAVDLINGIGRAVGLDPVKVEGATGYIDTNYKGKADAALEALRSGSDIAFIHLESPDESGHEGNSEHKLKSIQDIDSLIVGPVYDALSSEYTDYSIIIMPDHSTPIKVRTHTPEPVPFLIYSSKGISGSDKYKSVDSFSEKNSASTGLYFDDASVIVEAMIRNTL